MARKPRIEITGGLYHIITRGNNRRRIFRSQDEFLAFLESQKAKRPFYLYSCCLMPNHVHLLAEMLDDPISRYARPAHTAYSRYHNRKYRKIGHLFQDYVGQRGVRLDFVEIRTSDPSSTRSEA